MGMYDRVFIRCPKCGNVHEFQSKAKDCCLFSYDISAVPIEIARDINGDSAECSCGCEFKIVIPSLPEEIAMDIRIIKGSNDHTTR